MTSCKTMDVPHDPLIAAEVEALAAAEMCDPGTHGPTTLGLIELLLKDQRQLDQWARSPRTQRELIPRFLAIGLLGYTIFGVALTIVFNAAQVWPELTPAAEWLARGSGTLLGFEGDSASAFYMRWLDGSAFKLIAAFACGLIGSIGICLPSFYFYGLLAGVHTTMLQVTANALRGMASGAVALIGALPIYFAAVLGLLVLPAPHALVTSICYLGLALPFIAGVYGTRSLYIAFVGLADTLPVERRIRRERFLRRLLVAWSVCFTAVTPVMIFTLWEFLGP